MLVYLLFFGLVLSSCGSGDIPRQSPLDTAENHYQRGLVYVERGELIQAHREFARAQLLEGDYPGSYVGFALVSMAQGEYWQARKKLEKALHLDRNFVDAHSALGRVVAAEGLSQGRKLGDWLPEALRAFKKAEALDPQNPEVFWHRGQAYLQAGNLVLAREALSQIVALNRGHWVGKAMAEIERIQMVERASPGSDLGRQIGLKEQITRGELAVLLIEELRLGELLKKRGVNVRREAYDLDVAEAETTVADLEYSWARPWVEEIIGLGVQGLELFPDGTFRPDAPLTRAHYALVNQGVLVLLSGDADLTTRYIGEKTRFPDVRSDFYAYNAIALSAERGIMEADKISGNFHPLGAVSGAEALLITRELQNAFRMEF